MPAKTIYVFECFTADKPSLMGCLYADTLRGGETCSFEYDAGWLNAHAGRYFLDPDLHPYQGRQYAPTDKELFGLFSDSCPDRWGRNLMRRREAVTANREKRKPLPLKETDCLLGVHDEGRMGGPALCAEAGRPVSGLRQRCAGASPGGAAGPGSCLPRF